VAERKPFLLRIDQEILSLLQKWADDELRSLNGQAEYILRKALLDAGRLPGKKGKNNSIDKDLNQ
jgi:hypothetical protein